MIPDMTTGMRHFAEIHPVSPTNIPVKHEQTAAPPHLHDQVWPELGHTRDADAGLCRTVRCPYACMTWYAISALSVEWEQRHGAAPHARSVVTREGNRVARTAKDHGRRNAALS
jgi:hypothetical protein